MNVAVCDDNAADRAVICEYISRYCEVSGFVCDIHAFENGESMLDAFTSGAFDIIFLDIFMPGVNGMKIAQKIRQKDPFCALVFITISEDYIRESFSVLVTSYVVKPVTPESMATVFAACYKIFLKNARYIEVKSGYQKIKIPLVRIYYVEVEGRVTLFHTSTGIIRTYMPIDEAGERLENSCFLRCHRAFIINMNHVIDIEDYDLLMRNGLRIPVRKNGRKETRAAMSDFMSKRMFEIGGIV